MTIKHYSLGFAFNEAVTQVVLINKTKPDWQKGYLNGVGGTVEVGESYIDAMQREFLEEAAVETFQTEWKEVATISRTEVYYCKVFSIILTNKQFGGVRTMEQEKVECFPLEHIYKYRNRLLPNLPALIGLSLDKQSPQVLLMYR